MDYSDIYNPDTDFDRWYTRSTAQLIVPLIRPGDRVLELGCATGLMTADLVGAGATVTAIDRSPSYLEVARARSLPGVTWIQDDLDSWSASDVYHHVVAVNTIHHLADQVRILRQCARSLGNGGMLHVTLQNPRSLHRQIAFASGMVDSLTAISATNAKFDVRGVWDADEVIAMGADAGLRCLHRTSTMIKPFPNDVMTTLADEILETLIAASARFPELGAMNYFLFVSAQPERNFVST